MNANAPASLPAARFGLREIARVEVRGTPWVVYSDVAYIWAVAPKIWDAETTTDDYSLWCAGSAAAGGEALCGEIAAAAGLVGIYSAGDACWVDAAPVCEECGAPFREGRFPTFATCSRCGQMLCEACLGNACGTGAHAEAPGSQIGGENPEWSR